MEHSAGNSNVFVREWSGKPKGHVVNGHKHNFDHLTIVFTGAILGKFRLTDGRLVEQEFLAPDRFLVKAGVEHEITVLEEGTEYWCVYAHRTAQGDVVQEYTGWRKAYE